ncbi:MgtC family protein [uncultured archaeon]|nr:MgtC family protein [uncultured archaeon]
MIGEIELVGRIIFSLLAGGLIGIERELGHEPAGLRTHMLVCLGAMLFTAMSFEAAGTFDPTRIASGIVTGIGFLGAGTIFKDKDRVKGLTTAADLWVIAAIGMAIGFGYYVMAAVSTVLLFGVLSAKKFFIDPKKTAN